MLRTVLLLLLIHCIAFSTVSDAAQPNVVWIIADDMSPDIAAYGAAGVKTPNLDRLAKEGRRYTRAYATAPVCSSSRSAFILGCYQTTTGLHAHDVENPQPLAAPYVPLPTILREAGWYVTNAAAPGSSRSGRSIAKGKTSGDRGALPAVATEPSLSEIQAAKRGGYQRTWMKRVGKSEPTDDERVRWWEQLYGLLR